MNVPDLPNVTKNAMTIAVTEEMLMDMGDRGPRWRDIPDRDRWAALWRKPRIRVDQMASGVRFNWPGFPTPPPYECWDPRVLPEIGPLLPLERPLTLAWLRGRLVAASACLRLSLAWMSLRHPDEVMRNMEDDW